jgi:hypothetical protein
MWKAVVAGTAALAIAGSTLVYAQQRGRQDGPRRWQPSTEDMRAFGEARLAGLKAGLALNADQEKNWPAFEQAAREMSKLRVDRLSAAMNARRSGQPPVTDPAERLRQRATAMSESGAALKKLADATDPLYKSLDDSQKRRFAMLGRLAGPRMGGHGGEFRGRDGRDDRGPRGFDGRPRRMDGPDGIERGPSRTERGPGGFDRGERSL